MVIIKNNKYNTSEYRVFHHITEVTPQLCISGHKVRHFTYLFNITEYTILKIGTSYCKNHGLLQNHMKNDLLISVLREFIKSKSFFDYNIDYINLSKPIFNFIKSTIDKKIEYFQNLNLSSDEIEYYDYRLPLEHVKRDILEIKAEYFPEDKFPEFSEEFFTILERINDLLNYQNNKEIDKIEESLTNIQNEILELLGSDSHEFERNSEEIKRFEEYEIFEQKYIDSKIEEYEKEKEEKEEMDEIVKTILREITEDIEKSESEKEEKSLKNINQKIDIQKKECTELTERISILKEEIIEFNIEFAIFKNNLKNFQKNIESQENKTYSLFVKYNIPWIK